MAGSPLRGYRGPVERLCTPRGSVRNRPKSIPCSITRSGDVYITFPSGHEPFRLRARPPEQSRTRYTEAADHHPRLSTRTAIRPIRRHPAAFGHLDRRISGKKAASGNVFGLVGC
ncbi:hypothetical protein SXIM_45720 [Streptomyces xiamenensis]|uniref:Uncharacterized protein n=1 Tax=Streptomyces xiamenensis TaxID=408015 RepID=A0A0F7CQ82_9ACTN|nr:hypothetical protein SXIM_45720 [Streptomyces xiamenensis]